MPKPTSHRIADDGLGVSLTTPGGGSAELPLKSLVPGEHLLAHPGLRITGATGRDDQLQVTLSDGSSHTVTRACFGLDEHESDADLLVTGIAELLTDAGLDPEGGLTLIHEAALAVRGGRVLALGSEVEVRGAVRCTEGTRRVDARGRFVSPGLVDPHTHPAFGGDRSGEFALRARGASYQEIAAAGGGIRSTMAATRSASDAELEAATTTRIAALVAHGVTTLEAKSGYALDAPGELRLLRVLRRLDRALPVDLSTTLLGAHVLPPEFSEDRAAYIDLVCNEMIPQAAAERLADAVDVYCDAGAFTRDESRQVLTAARAHGLARRIHAEQFVDLGSAGMAADLGAISADHLEAVSPADMAKMAAAGTVAVLLPGAALTLACPWPPVAALREAGVALAIGTDLNPGTSMTANLPLMMSLGCMQMGMTVEEVWRAVTTVAAKAALRPDAGTLRVGSAADFVIWDCGHHGAVPYHLGANLVRTVYKGGRVAVERQNG